MIFDSVLVVALEVKRKIMLMDQLNHPHQKVRTLESLIHLFEIGYIFRKERSHHLGTYWGGTMECVDDYRYRLEIVDNSSIAPNNI